MKQPSFIFGGNTGLSYDQIKRQREIADQLLQANMSTPQNVGEGLSAIGRALAAKAIDKRTTRADEANKAAYETKRADIFGSISSSMGGASPASYSPAPQPTAGQSVANDTMSVLGNFGGLEQQYGLPQGYLDRTYMIESGGNPNAQNPNSSAGGGFQFIDSTAKQYGLTDKTDLGASAAAAARLAADNKAMLVQALGREPTAGELYLAHQQGGAGAAKLLANPNARAVDIVGAEAVTLNGGNPNMTASDFAGKWVQKFGGAPAQPAQGQPQGQPPVNPAILMQLAEIQGNPYASESDKAIAQMLMGQVQQSMDPMRQMEMERARLELDALKKPQPPAVIGEREQLAARGGLQPGTPEYQAFMLTGELPNEAGGDVPADFRSLQLRAEAAGLQPGTEEYQSFMQQGAGGGAPAAFVSLDMQAQAAGFAPGTPEYQEFMATRGAGLIAQAKTEGTAAGDAVVNLGSAVAKADRAVDLIDQISGDEALPSITGMVQGNLPAGTPIIGGGQAGVDLEAKILQLQGTAFLEAFEALKGGGAITEVEGTKAEQAMARLQRAQSTEAYKAALADLKEVINNGKIRAQEKAAAAGGATSTGGKKRMRFNPETGMVE